MYLKLQLKILNTASEILFHIQVAFHYPVMYTYQYFHMLSKGRFAAKQIMLQNAFIQYFYTAFTYVLFSLTSLFFG
jgi:hypothetical protein